MIYSAPMRKIFSRLEQENTFLYAILGFSLLLRLAYVIKSGSGGLSPDSHDWMNTAWSLATGNGFGGSWRPPGYIFYLAGVFLIFGKSIIAAKAMNALLGTFTILLAYLAARTLFNRRVARITAVLLGFYPYLVAYTGDLISETFLTFMLAAAVYFIARASAAPSAGNIAAAGIFMGLTALTKSTTLPFFLLACGWLWQNTGSFRTGFIAGAFALLAIAPWSFRNYFHYGNSYVMPVNTPWYSLYGSTCDEALVFASLPARDSPMGEATVAGVIPKDWEYVSALPLPERDKYCKEKAIGWIKANPDKFIILMGSRLLHFWRLYPLMAWPWQKYAAMATSGLYIPLSLAGLIVGWRKYSGTALLAALFASYTAVHLFFAMTLRYRVPMDPFVILMAAVALDAAVERFLPALAVETNGRTP